MPDPEVNWRKSSYSVGNGACAEVAMVGGQGGYAVAVRDSKNPGPVLEFSPAAWMKFLATVKGVQEDGRA